MENEIHEIVQKFLEKINSKLIRIRIDFEKSNNLYRLNIDTDDASLLIGHHGETINAIQHLIKLIAWKTHPKEEFTFYLDIDNYKKRQEESIIKIADRKVDMVRKLSSPQSLPAMSPYFRRVVHLYLAQDKFNDIRTESLGEGELRYVVIKPQLII